MSINLKETVEYKEHDFKVVECPCCKNQTLDNHFICGICGWEYDGEREDDSYSSANKMTPAEFRKLHWS